MPTEKELNKFEAFSKSKICMGDLKFKDLFSVQAGDYAKALALQAKLTPLHDALFFETNPGPVKYAAHRLGLCRPEVRLPLAPITEPTKKAVDAALAHAGLLAKVAAE